MSQAIRAALTASDSVFNTVPDSTLFSRTNDRQNTFASTHGRDFSVPGPTQSTQVVYDSTSWSAVPPPLGFDDLAPSSIEGSGHRRFAPTLGSVQYDPATASGGPDWQMRPLTSTAVRAPRHFPREGVRGGRIQDPPRPAGEGGSSDTLNCPTYRFVWVDE